MSNITNSKSQTNQKLSQYERNELIRIKRIDFIKLLEDLPPSYNKISNMRTYLHTFIDNTNDDNILLMLR
jgi:hypothetical protein